MERLGELTAALKNQSGRFTAGRFLQVLKQGKGSVGAMTQFIDQQNWNDRIALKAAVSAIGSADFPSAFNPIGESFLAAMRSDSIPLRLVGLRRVPMWTRLLIGAAGVVAAEISAGQAIPVLKGSWASSILEPRKFAGIQIFSDELMASLTPIASAAILDGLAGATAEAENLSFISPYVVGSVLNGAPNFAGTGAGLAAVDADLLRLVGMVPGAFRGGAFAMTMETATFLALLRGSGGAPAFPAITPEGGYLIGLPVLITSAANLAGSPVSRIIGLLSPTEIYWADDNVVRLDVSSAASLKLESAPTLAPGATVSMFSTGATATRAIRESAWYARSGAGAYFTTAY